ncbi:hypothetical protein [Cohnella sp. REN36]|uniref:hypothetical protein n=1 Tax=Cohnella sp. REN36 TaxID=2887347 RepID=UPI001D13D394|nr:hypothetical protein [Cohnella sp. REN36]MCC3373550.1 hypothetical protein [Cohnella sp. REN36]
MFFVTALETLGTSYAFYFASVLCFGISLPITVVRTYQALYQKEIKRSVLVSTEIAVELLRIVQYILFIAYGTNTPLGSLFSPGSWKTMFAGIRQLDWIPFLWDLLGFIVVFGLYNALLFAILKPSIVQKLMDHVGIKRFEVSAVRTAAMLAYKNLFLIPVSMIYLFKILNLY